MKKSLGNTLNNVEAYVIIDNNHMLAHPSITEEMLADAIRKIDYTPTFWMDSVDLGYVVGFDGCVETNDTDDIRMECRPGRDILSRIVYGRKPEETTLVTVGLCTDDDGLVTVFTAFPGKKAPKELSDPRLSEKERPEAEAFWATHALCAQEGGEDK